MADLPFEIPQQPRAWLVGQAGVEHLATDEGTTLLGMAEPEQARNGRGVGAAVGGQFQQPGRRTGLLPSHHRGAAAEINGDGARHGEGGQAAVECCPKLALKKPPEMLTSSDLNPKELAKRADSLIRHSSNRYLTTVRIAFRAKQRRFDDFDGLLDDSMIKPVQRAIIELSDEQDQPDLLPG